MNAGNTNTPPSSHIEIGDGVAKKILAGATDAAPVSGLTHNFYRYPARFSPQFARAIITAFSDPGDLVFDPFMGGGTSLVEARALGRRAVGTDISSLAAFVSEVKTTILEPNDISIIRQWSENLPGALNIHSPSHRHMDWAEQGYQRNLGNPKTWRIRKLIELALVEVEGLKKVKHQQFARCVILKTAQWALDGRKKLTSAPEFRNRLMKNLDDMVFWANEFREHVLKSEKTFQIVTESSCIHHSTIGIENHPSFKDKDAPKLVVTSPPYPGVHVLYHRWQVDGRRETPAPFWIANKLDGAGSSFYTMGDRKEKNQDTYFGNIGDSFNSLSSILDKESLVVQMVAFSEVKWQLPRYLETMKNSGFREITFSQLATASDGRLWRKVPNRKWHAEQKGDTPGSKEVVLIHRLANQLDQRASLTQPDLNPLQHNHP